MLFFVIGIFFSWSSLAQTLSPSQQSTLDTLQTEAQQDQGKVLGILAKSQKALYQQRHTSSLTEGSCLIGTCGGAKEEEGSDLTSGHSTEPFLLQSKKPLVFISASMPLEALKNLAFQTKAQGGILVIRGFIKDTLKETASLVDALDFPLEIDPLLFEKFEIKQVPCIMIFEKRKWVKVTGNVTIQFAKHLAKAKVS